MGSRIPAIGSQCCSEAPGNFPTNSQLFLQHTSACWCTQTNPSLSRNRNMQSSMSNSAASLLFWLKAFRLLSALKHPQFTCRARTWYCWSSLARATATSVTSFTPSIQLFCYTHHLRTGQRQVATLLLVTLIKHHDSPMRQAGDTIPTHVIRW